MTTSGASASTPVEPQADERPWTPGPLIAVPDVGCEGLFAVAESEDARVHCASFCTKADATLYAAAPELAEALHGLIYAWRDALGRIGCSELDAAEAALLKATTGNATGAKRDSAEPPQ